MAQHVLCRALAETARMPDADEPGHFGEGFLEELEALGGQLRAEERQARDVPAGPREAGHESVAEGITHGRRDDRDGGGRLLCGAGRGGAPGNDEVDLETDQI